MLCNHMNQDAGDVRYAAVELKKSSKHDSAEDENQCQESFCVYLKIN